MVPTSKNISSQYLRKEEIYVSIIEIKDPVHYIVKENPSLNCSPDVKNFMVMEETMQKFYKSMDPGFLEFPYKDSILVSHIDGKFYRVKVLTIFASAEGHLFKVYLLDYGREVNVSKQQLYDIQKHFLTHPFQAVELKLVGIEPVTLIMSEIDLTVSYGPIDHWDPSAHDYVKSLKERMNCTYMKVQGTANNQVLGDLFICLPDCQTICLSDELVDKKFARYNKAGWKSEQEIDAAIENMLDLYEEEEIVGKPDHEAMESSVTCTMASTGRNIRNTLRTKIANPSSLALTAPSNSAKTSPIGKENVTDSGKKLQLLRKVQQIMSKNSDSNLVDNTRPRKSMPVNDAISSPSTVGLKRKDNHVMSNSVTPEKSTFDKLSHLQKLAKYKQEKALCKSPLAPLDNSHLSSPSNNVQADSDGCAVNVSTSEFKLICPSDESENKAVSKCPISKKSPVDSSPSVQQRRPVSFRKLNEILYNSKVQSPSSHTDSSDPNLVKMSVNASCVTTGTLVGNTKSQNLSNDSYELKNLSDTVECISFQTNGFSNNTKKEETFPVTSQNEQKFCAKNQPPVSKIVSKVDACNHVSSIYKEKQILKEDKMQIFTKLSSKEILKDRFSDVYDPKTTVETNNQNDSCVSSVIQHSEVGVQCALLSTESFASTDTNSFAPSKRKPINFQKLKEILYKNKEQTHILSNSDCAIKNAVISPSNEMEAGLKDMKFQNESYNANSNIINNEGNNEMKNKNLACSESSDHENLETKCATVCEVMETNEKLQKLCENTESTPLLNSEGAHCEKEIDDEIEIKLVSSNTEEENEVFPVAENLQHMCFEDEVSSVADIEQHVFAEKKFSSHPEIQQHESVKDWFPSDGDNQHMPVIIASCEEENYLSEIVSSKEEHTVSDLKADNLCDDPRIYNDSMTSKVKENDLCETVLDICNDNEIPEVFYKEEHVVSEINAVNLCNAPKVYEDDTLIANVEGKNLNDVVSDIHNSDEIPEVSNKEEHTMSILKADNSLISKIDEDDSVISNVKEENLSEAESDIHKNGEVIKEVFNNDEHILSGLKSDNSCDVPKIDNDDSLISNIEEKELCETVSDIHDNEVIEIFDKEEQEVSGLKTDISCDALKVEEGGSLISEIKEKAIGEAVPDIHNDDEILPDDFAQLPDQLSTDDILKDISSDTSDPEDLVTYAVTKKDEADSEDKD